MVLSTGVEGAALMVEEVGSSAMTVDTEVEVEVVVDGIELLGVVVVGIQRC